MNKTVDYISKAQMMVGITFLFIFFVAIIIQITSRHLGVSIIWTGEVSTNSFIWAILMGSSVMVYHREHFNFNYLERKLSYATWKKITIFNDSILIVFNSVLLLYGIQVTQGFWDYSWSSLPFLKMGYVWIAVPIMSFTMILYSLSHLIDNIRGK